MLIYSVGFVCWKGLSEQLAPVPRYLGLPLGRFDGWRTEIIQRLIYSHDLQLTSLSAGILTGLLAWTPRHWFSLWLFELPHGIVPGFQQRCPKRTRQKPYEFLLLASEVTLCTSALIKSLPNSRGDNTGFTSQREECQNHNEREHLWKTQPATSLLYEEGGIPCQVFVLHAFPMAGARAWLFLRIL